MNPFKTPPRNDTDRLWHDWTGSTRSSAERRAVRLAGGVEAAPCRVSLLAVASLGWSVFAVGVWLFAGLLLLPAAAIGIVLGLLGLHALRCAPRLGGHGLAWAGVLGGALFLAAALLLNGPALTGTTEPLLLQFVDLARSAATR